MDHVGVTLMRKWLVVLLNNFRLRHVVWDYLEYSVKCLKKRMLWMYLFDDTYRILPDKVPSPFPLRPYVNRTMESCDVIV